jgi:hypothetical protein
MAKKKRKTKRSGEEGLPTWIVTVGVAAVLAVLLWGCACAMYDTAHGYRWVFGDPENPNFRPRRTAGIGFLIAGIIAFVVNSVTYLPQIHLVIGFIFRERMWFVFFSLLVLGGTILAGWMLKRMEDSMRDGNPFAKNRPKK